MKHLLISTAILAASAPTLAHATTVYPGCAVPALKAGHHTFYIDPINGSMKGDGSAAKPWHTLAEVLNTDNKLLSTNSHNPRTWNQGDHTSYITLNPTGPIKSGDVLMLKTGNHGDVVIRSSANTDFITVMPAPGEAPVVSSIKLIASQKWLFQGVKIIGSHPIKGTVTSTVDLGATVDWMGNSSDNIFENGEVMAAVDTTGWTDKDWQTKPDGYAIMLRGHCMAANNNHLHNIINGIAFGGDSGIVEGNLITQMNNDGIDFYGSNQIIRKNTIKDGVNVYSTEVLHPDGIQGWSMRDAKSQLIVNKHDLIDGNTIIKKGDGNTSQMQGISIFNGLWDGLTITNNVVVSNVYHGIAMVGGKNVSITNNTVLASDPTHFSTWITAGMGCCRADIPKSVNVVVRNNITNSLVIGDPAVTFDHNTIGARMVTRKPDLQWLYTVKSGQSLGTNKVDPAVLNQFVQADTASGQYDLKLRPNSVAIGAGTNLNAPGYDIVNRKRSTPFDLGAYMH